MARRLSEGYAHTLYRVWFFVLHLIKSNSKEFSHDQLLVRLNKHNFNTPKEYSLHVIEHNVINKAIRNIFRAYQNNNNVEIERLRRIFESNNDDKIDRLIRTNTSASEDIKEILILFKEIEMSFGLTDYTKLKCFVGPNSTINRQHNRIYELLYKVKYNYNYFITKFNVIETGDKILVKCSEVVKDNIFKTDGSLIKFLIIDYVVGFLITHISISFHTKTFIGQTFAIPVAVIIKFPELKSEVYPTVAPLGSKKPGENTWNFVCAFAAIPVSNGCVFEI